ncbi:MAG: hypothetical protein HZA68_05075 [Rhodovulum sp.]|nr:hypothetical protein [Rhodovulum sp.]
MTEHSTPNSILQAAMTAGRCMASPVALPEALADACLILGDLDSALRRRHPGGPDRAATLDATTRALWRRARVFLGVHMPGLLHRPDVDEAADLDRIATAEGTF